MRSSRAATLFPDDIIERQLGLDQRKPETNLSKEKYRKTVQTTSQKYPLPFSIRTRTHTHTHSGLNSNLDYGPGINTPLQTEAVRGYTVSPLLTAHIRFALKYPDVRGSGLANGAQNVHICHDSCM